MESPNPSTAVNFERFASEYEKELGRSERLDKSLKSIILSKCINTPRGISRVVSVSTFIRALGESRWSQAPPPVTPLGLPPPGVPPPPPPVLSPTSMAAGEGEKGFRKREMVCRYFNNPKGCYYGNTCMYLHPGTDVDDID